MLHDTNHSEPKNARSKLLRLVRDIPNLNAERLARSRLCYPSLLRPGEEEESIGLPDLDITELWDEIEREIDEDLKISPHDQEDTAYPIERLFRGIKMAAKKCEFGRTEIEQWHKTLVFSENKVTRNSRQKRFDWVKTTSIDYVDGIPVNASLSVANSWFSETIVQGILDEKSPRHSRAVVGSPGCGKSTLFKYLLSENADLLDRKNLVFSRFEFLKFWKWREQRETKEQALQDYMSFIHARDLFLNHFFKLVDGCRFELRWEYKEDAWRHAKLDRLEHEVQKHAGHFGIAREGVLQLLVQETFAKASLGNKDLIEWLASRSTTERQLLIAALYQPDVHLVTVFDGLDSLRVEDAFRESPEWQAVDHIVRNRRFLSAPNQLSDAGLSVNTDSIVIMRNNTADALEARYASIGEPLGFQKYYHLDPINGLTAMVSLVIRAVDYIPDVAALNDEGLDKFVFDVMRIVQRTVLAIWRGHGPTVPSDLIYDFFDGNLRRTFYFVARVMFWSVREMLKLRYLNPEEYHPAPTPTLIAAVASSRGNDFLHHKSYRVLELLLFRKGDWFQNQAFVLDTTDPMMKDIGVVKRVVGNAKFSGEIDNIFNYTSPDHVPNLDRHCLLEKIRIVQLCTEKSLSFLELQSGLKKEFGFVVSDLKLLIRFLQKTDFITAKVNRPTSGVEFRYSATARGKLCVSSLISSLSYVEHVFHRTFLPEVLLDTVDDRPRSQGTRKWAAQSARNAFILLAYFKALEANPANGISAAERFRLFARLQKNLIKSLERMTNPSFRSTDTFKQSPPSNRDATLICEMAVKNIEATLDDWRVKGLL